MLRVERQAKMLQILRDRGFVTSDEMAQAFGITVATVRRDLKALSGQDLVELDHGGAAIKDYLSRFVEPQYSAKTHLNLAEKRAIALAACELIRDGDTIILDSGTTTRQIAIALKETNRRGITVLTNDTRVANELCADREIDVVMLGGRLRRSFYYCYGPHAETVLRDLRAHKCFLATDAASETHGISSSFLEEVPLKQLMIEVCDSVILVADATKFGTHAPYRVCSWAVIDRAITDSRIAVGFRDFLRSHAVCVHAVAPAAERT